MNPEVINVTRTHLPDRKKFDAYIDRLYETTRVTNNGEFVKELTARLEGYLGVENLLLVSNGTMALQIAYKTLGITGQAITTPFSFVATTSSLVWVGIEPVFANINQKTFCIDPVNIEKAITPETTAIVPVHLFGNACEVEAIDAIAKKYGLKTVFFALATSLMDSGFIQALIRKKYVSQTDYFTAFYTNLVLGLLAYALLFAASPSIAGFYDEPKLILLVRVVGLVVIINSFRLVQVTDLTRKLNIKGQFRVTLPAAVFSGLVAGIMAALGFGIVFYCYSVLLGCK